MASFLTVTSRLSKDASLKASVEANVTAISERRAIITTKEECDSEQIEAR